MIAPDELRPESQAMPTTIRYQASTQATVIAAMPALLVNLAILFILMHTQIAHTTE